MLLAINDLHHPKKPAMTGEIRRESIQNYFGLYIEHCPGASANG